MGADHRIVPAIKQALSMLRQAREALFFAQCPAAVATSARLSNQPRVRFVSPSDACNPVRWPVKRASDGPVSPKSARQAMTLQEAKSIARHLRLTLRKVRSGDYRVNFRDGNEATAYYTDNLEDAFKTAVEMARKRALRAGQPGSDEQMFGVDEQIPYGGQSD
jgi:hypothetical protein